jgi:hypothetical protein
VAHAVLAPLFALLLLVAALPARAASVTATWQGGAGSWTEPANWSGTVVPRNTITDSYDAVIDGANPVSSQVTLDAEATIGSLHIDAGDSLILTPTGALTLDGDRIENAGQIVLQGAGGFEVQSLGTHSYPSQTTLLGGGSVRFDGGGITGSTLVNMDNRIAGWGLIYVQSNLPFTNYGVVEADVAGKELLIDGEVNYGTMRAVAGGTLFFDSSVSPDKNFGTIEALDGSRVHGSDSNSSFGGTFSALRHSTMDLFGYYEGTAFVTDSDSLITIGGSTGGLKDVTLDGNFVVNPFRVVGTITNRGNIQDAVFNVGSEPATILNQGSIVMNGADGGELSLAGGGTVTLDAGLMTALLRNIDNQIRGVGNVQRLVQNGGLIEAAGGVLSVRSDIVPATDHTGMFAAAPGGVLDMQATVTGTGAWLADGGQIHVTGDVGTTGNIEVLHGGSLVVDSKMSGDNLLVDATSSLDIQGILRVAGNVDFDGAHNGRWHFAPTASLEADGGHSAVVGDWNDWRSFEAAGRDQGLTSAGFTSENFYLPELVIGPDGHIFLRDHFDNGNHVGEDDEAVYVDTLVFSDPLGALNLNGIHLYYNTLVGSVDQIIDVAVPEPGTGWLLGAALAAALAARRRSSAESPI